MCLANNVLKQVSSKNMSACVRATETYWIVCLVGSSTYSALRLALPWRPPSRPGSFIARQQRNRVATRISVQLQASCGENMAV